VPRDCVDPTALDQLHRRGAPVIEEPLEFENTGYRPQDQLLHIAAIRYSFVLVALGIAKPMNFHAFHGLVLGRTGVMRRQHDRLDAVRDQVPQQQRDKHAGMVAIMTRVIMG